jgi:hypothetical protein
VGVFEQPGGQSGPNQRDVRSQGARVAAGYSGCHQGAVCAQVLSDPGNGASCDAQQGLKQFLLALDRYQVVLIDAAIKILHAEADGGLGNHGQQGYGPVQCIAQD